MWCDAVLAQFLDEAVAVAALVGCESDTLGSSQIVHELDDSIDFCGTVTFVTCCWHETMAIVHEHLPKMGQARGFSGSFLG